MRPTILSSWWRSRRSNVAADHVDLPYVRDPNLDLPLTRGANPVLHALAEQLEGQPVSLILTDQNGTVLNRLTGDADLRRHLDKVRLAPGFSYAEKFVGTNGIGSALEAGKPLHVFGHEHYAEYLEDLACVGVPIHHPITGRIAGAVDLTCWRKDAGPLLVTLAKTTAGQIKQALLNTEGTRELELFQAYQQACRRTTGMVLALNKDMVMMNDQARRLLEPADQTLLLGHAAEALASEHTGPVVVDLHTGKKARISCRPVRGDTQLAGGIVHVTLIEPEDGESHGNLPAMRMFLPGLVGGGSQWLRACHQVDNGYAAGEWLALTGESGVGKLALARAVHQRHNASASFHVLDAAECPGPKLIEKVRAELLEHRVRALVIRHVDRLGSEHLAEVTETLRQAAVDREDDPAWVAVTQATDQKARSELARLLELFPSTVEVPPLRHHMEDLRELVPFFLAKLSHGSELTCSHDSMQLLMRSDWPNNAEQLYQVLKYIVRHRRRVGFIQPQDLPPRYRTISRRQLSQLESIERDAIVQGLLDNNGNKSQAAKSLGMSRATIYRKIRDYGIVTPSS